MAHQICVPRDDQRDVRLVGFEGNGDDVAHQAAVITSLLASSAGIHQQIYGSVQKCINWPVALVCTICSEPFKVAIPTTCSPSNPFTADGPHSPARVKSPNLVSNGNFCMFVTMSSCPIPCAIARPPLSTLAWFEDFSSSIPDTLLTPSIVWKGRRPSFAQAPGPKSCCRMGVRMTRSRQSTQARSRSRH